MTKQAKARLIPFRRRASNIDALSDAALVAACATGDPNALASLYDRLCDDVTRFLGRLTYVDAQDIQDLVNDVFLAAFRGAPSYRRDSSVKTWMFAIASNIARERCRKAMRGRAALDLVTQDLAHCEPHSLERTVITEHLIAHVARCIPSLPYDLRTAFLMCDVEELPGVEVARALGIPKGTLYRRVHEARQMLRALIEGDAP